MKAGVRIFTDGACSGNPGPGGWGAVLRYQDTVREITGSENPTTNNRMELLAAISALEALRRPVTVDLYTDSSYLRNGMTGWLRGWKRNGWRTASGRPVKNADLWQRLETAAQLHDVTWHWVRGHAGNPDNERADRLARGAVPGKSAGNTMRHGKDRNSSVGRRGKDRQ